jgi:hypothetical protein
VLGARWLSQPLATFAVLTFPNQEVQIIPFKALENVVGTTGYSKSIVNCYLLSLKYSLLLLSLILPILIQIGYCLVTSR